MKYMFCVMIVSTFLVFPNAELKAETKNGFSMWGWAYESYEELMSLPKYCFAKFAPAEKYGRLKAKWKRSIGEDFIHFHHY